jgi:hypothetical protein
MLRLGSIQLDGRPATSAMALTAGHPAKLVFFLILERFLQTSRWHFIAVAGPVTFRNL